GGKLGDDLSYRIYALSSRRDHSFNADSANNDGWYLGQTGVSLEWRPSEADEVIVHGNVYLGNQGEPEASALDGQNFLGRWSRRLSETSSLVVQAYYDRTWRRDRPSTIFDEVETADFEIDHRFRVGQRHNFVWGGGYRLIRNNTVTTTRFVGLIPENRDMPLYSAFIQDEIALAEDRLRLVLGTKLQHNVYTGFEWQPSARLAWMQ